MIGGVGELAGAALLLPVLRASRREGAPTAAAPAGVAPRDDSVDPLRAPGWS